MKRSQLYDMFSTLWDVSFWLLLVYFWFHSFMFQRVFIPFTDILLTRSQSKMLLIALILVCSIINLWLGFYKKIHNSSLFLLSIVSMPYGLYLLLEIHRDHPILVYCMIGAQFVALWVWSYWAFIIPIQQHKCRPILPIKLLAHFFQLAQATLGLFSCILMAVTILVEAFSFSVISRNSAINLLVGGSPNSWPTHQELYEMLANENWDTCTIQQKVDVLQVVVNYESSYLGLPEAITVTCSRGDPDRLGYYNHSKLQIVLNEDHLHHDSVIECVDTALHEVYHGYQNYLCEVYETLDAEYHSLLGIREAEQYLCDIERYATSKNDFESYYFLSLEVHAREYAKERAHLYID